VFQFEFHGIAVYFSCGILTVETMRRFTQLANELSKKAEKYAADEGVRLSKSNHGKLRLISYAIGIIVVIFIAIWMASRR